MDSWQPATEGIVTDRDKYVNLSIIFKNYLIFLK